MAFLKLRCETAYATGAVKTNLGMTAFARKLTRAGLPTAYTGGTLSVTCGDDQWTFAEWESNGFGQTGWLSFSAKGDIGTLSRRLAAIGVRHMFDHSRPFDLEIHDTRCVTQYAHQWATDYGIGPKGSMPSIETFDEQL